MAFKPIDPTKIGQDRQFKDAVEQYDAMNGKYDDKVESQSVESLLPLKEFPKAPDPKPYR